MVKSDNNCKSVVPDGKPNVISFNLIYYREGVFFLSTFASSKSCRERATNRLQAVATPPVYTFIENNV